MITIVDYGMGNLESVKNMFRKLKVEARISEDVKEIEQANKIILPGVGAFDRAMEQINTKGIREVLDRKACQEKIPIFGICLGMQLLTKGSDEGQLPGLGWIDAYTYKFKPDHGNGIRIPHMGWNEIQVVNDCDLTKGLNNLTTTNENPRYYFVHSYHVKVENQQDSMLKTNYFIKFDSGIHKKNVYGVQFHPEKSHKFGMKMLQNFAELDC